MKVVAASLFLLFGILVAGCGGGTTGSSSEEPTASRTTTAAERTEPPVQDQSEIEKTPAEEAQLTREYADLGRWKTLKKAAGAREGRLIIPVGPPPEDKAVIRDLRKGHGAKLEQDNQYQFQYLGFDYSGGELVENSWKETGGWWVYGSGESNEAWEAGLRGMRVGGVRELIAPAALLHDNDAAVYLFRLTRVFKEK
jgi:FKBP-type peptidyl-prolyl cis-trans isomerase